MTVVRGEVTSLGRHPRGSRRGPGWWPPALLGLVLAATSAAVPALVGSGPRAEGRTAAAAPVATAPALAPVPSGPASAAPAVPPVTATATGTVTPTPTPTRPKPVFRPLRIDAGDPANTQIHTHVIDCVTCAAGSRVQYLGEGHTTVVNLRKVPVGGRRTMTVVYESDGPRTLDITVAGGPVISRTLSGAGDWVTPARVRIPITLPAGSSRIVFFNNQGPAPDLDQILIS